VHCSAGQTRGTFCWQVPHIDRHLWQSLVPLICEGMLKDAPELGVLRSPDLSTLHVLAVRHIGCQTKVCRHWQAAVHGPTYLLFVKACSKMLLGLLCSGHLVPDIDRRLRYRPAVQCNQSLLWVTMHATSMISQCVATGQGLCHRVAIPLVREGMLKDAPELGVLRWVHVHKGCLTPLNGGLGTS
jgi:hypothetical protein